MAIVPDITQGSRLSDLNTELFNMATEARDKLPLSINHNTYRHGYDVGYNLGYAHGLEKAQAKLKQITRR